MDQTHEVKEMQEMIANLEAQLTDLYQDRENNSQNEALQKSLASLDAQLVDLYAERAEMPLSPHQVKEALHSMEEQIISLVDEKIELQKNVENLQNQIERLKSRSKHLGAAIMEAALFEIDETTKKVD
ncbi:MAG: hypothetical protein H7256_08005 [Bdellovibrio sp.]|nr:hypothetical protein [Bdellovibrio sp.]